MALYLVPSLILLAGVVDDLRSRKIHNPLVIAMAIIGIGSSFAFHQWAGVQSGALGFTTAILFSLPLVLAGILGAGDMKLLAAFGLATNWATVGSVLLYSIVWGALLGLLTALLRGEIKQLVLSTAQVAMRKKPEPKTLHRIPYSVALLFGWLSYLTLLRVPGGPL